MYITKVKRSFIRLRKKLRKPKYKILNNFSLPRNGVIIVDINYPKVLYLIVNDSKICFYSFIDGSSSISKLCRRVKKKQNLKSYDEIYVDLNQILLIDYSLELGKLKTTY